MPPPSTPPDLATLKRIRNDIIGSPSLKRQLLRSQPALLPALLPLLAQSALSGQGGSDVEGEGTQRRAEAVTVLGSLCREVECLPYLLDAGALSALLTALRASLSPPSSDPQAADDPSSPQAGPSTPYPSASDPLTRSLARALADLVGCMCEALHGARYGIGRPAYKGREEAHMALEVLVELSSLDCFLPLLAPAPAAAGAGPAAATAIAALVAHLRTAQETAPVLAWLPEQERVSAAKGKRGWEKKEEGGWVVGRLCAMLKGGDEKAQIAALHALATFLSQTPSLITTFGRFHAPIAQRIFDLSRSRPARVRLAACGTLTALLCHRPSRPAVGLAGRGEGETPPPSGLELNVLMGLQAVLEDEREEGDVRAGACWCLSTLVMDDRPRALHASQTGLLRTLCTLLRAFPPIDPASPASLDDLWEEPLPTVTLREACMTALASLALPDAGLRSQLAEQKPSVLPIIHASLSHPAPGVRHAACQVVRALSRSVAILRSSLVDEGVAGSVLGLVVREGRVKEEEGLEGFGLAVEGEDEGDTVKLELEGDEEMEMGLEAGAGDEGEAEGEVGSGTGGKELRQVKGDRRVLLAALAALCNFSADFSPVQHLLPEQGALPVLVRFATDPGDALLRMNGIWVLKNLVYRADWTLKKGVMDLMGWGRFVELCRDEDLRVREQALSMVRNLAASRDTDVSQTVRAMGAGEIVALVEEAMATGTDDVMMNALFVVVNTLPELYKASPAPTLHQSPTFLAALLACLSSPTQPLRVAAIRVIHALLQASLGKSDLRGAGIERRVREMDGGRWKAGLASGLGMARKSLGGLGEADGGEVESSLEVREIVKKVAAYFEEA
ncbi:ARM repeat-containing protein [Calocera cornea HHB12733]|uniref:ARM repeat-containing protein n=1 Tax=Calocera cornea HHB12733 TaxID=1353952 RepID=A0A165CH09_9BASI|nr:ARM repeat-containing protein [Calocera cornea HHB12733]